MTAYLALAAWASIPVLLVVGELRANPPKRPSPEFIERAAIVLGLAGVVVVGTGRALGVV